MPNEIFINRGNQSDCGNCDGVHPRGKASQVAMWQVWSEKFSTCANWTHVTKFANKFQLLRKFPRIRNANEMRAIVDRAEEKLNLKPKLKSESEAKVEAKVEGRKNLNRACISYKSLNEIISKSISISPGNTRNWNLHLYEACKQKNKKKTNKKQ